MHQVNGVNVWTHKTCQYIVLRTHLYIITVNLTVTHHWTDETTIILVLVDFF